jgi:hypothetical protein
MTRDKIIIKVLSIIRVIVLLFIIAYFYEYLMTLKQEQFNSVILYISLLNTIIIFKIERNEKK